MIKQCALVTFVWLGLASQAFAEPLPFEEVYGDEYGCAFHRDGSILTDGFFIVTREEIRGYDSFCRVEQTEWTGSVWVVEAMCSAEGEAFDNRFIVEPAGDAHYLFSVAGSDYWFDIRPCG